MSSLKYRKSIYAPLPQTTRGKPYFLGGDPKGKNFLYQCGNCVVIRDIEHPENADIYDEHARTVTASAYAPSGFYIASGDSAGVIRIWDTTQLEHPLKIELRVLGSAIYDIQWSPDSKRIVVGGDGREKYGHAFFADSGSSVGEISGHAKPINSVAFKQSRPYRVATGSEDFAVNWYEGPPFKYKGNRTEHSRFVNCVRFSPDGNFLCSVGSDKKAVIYEGKTGEKIRLLDAEHKGGIYCCSWSADNKSILTASGDRSCKIFDVETGKCTHTFQFAQTTENQQLGCLWQGDYLLSVNLAGHINYLDINDTSKPSRVLRGHNKFVTSVAYDKTNNHIYSGSYDSVITRWNFDDGITTPLTGTGHSNTIAEMTVNEGGDLVTASMDDSVRVTPTASLEYADKIGVDSPVSGCSSAKGINVAVSMNNVIVFDKNSVKSQVPVKYSPKSVAINPDATEVAVGGEDNHIHLYSLSGTTLTEKSTLEGHRDNVTSLSYSPDGKYLASGSKDRSVNYWDTSSGNLLSKGWCFHSSGINAVAWSPNSKRIASGSLDQNIYIWSIEDQMKRIFLKGAHRGGVNDVAWVDDSTIVSGGQDCSVRTFNVDA